MVESLVFISKSGTSVINTPISGLPQKTETRSGTIYEFLVDLESVKIVKKENLNVSWKSKNIRHSVIFDKINYEDVMICYNNDNSKMRIFVPH